MGIEIVALVIAGLAIAYTVYLAIQFNAFKRRFAAALGDPKDTESIEQLLASSHKRMREVNHRLSELEREYERLMLSSRLASQKIAIVRFNPFGDTGGDQSFSLAVLDAHDTGYVLTSIHGRQGTRVYVKPIEAGKSKYTLSQEEQHAFKQAAGQVPQQAAIAGDDSK